MLSPMHHSLKHKVNITSNFKIMKKPKDYVNIYSKVQIVNLPLI